MLLLPCANPALHFLVGHYTPTPRIRDSSLNHLLKSKFSHDFVMRCIFRLRLNNFGHLLFGQVICGDIAPAFSVGHRLTDENAHELLLIALRELGINIFRRWLRLQIRRGYLVIEV